MNQSNTYRQFQRKAILGLVIPTLFGTCLLVTIYLLSYQWYLGQRMQVLEAEKQAVYKDIALALQNEKNSSLGLLIALNEKEQLKTYRMDTDHALKRLELMLTGHIHLYADELTRTIEFRNKLEILRAEVLSQDFSVEKAQASFLTIMQGLNDRINSLSNSNSDYLMMATKRLLSLSQTYDAMLMATFKNMPMTDAHFVMMAKSWFDFLELEEKDRAADEESSREQKAANNVVAKVLRDREHGAFDLAPKKVEYLFEPLFKQEFKAVNRAYAHHARTIQLQEKETRKLVIFGGFVMVGMAGLFFIWLRTNYRQTKREFLRAHRLARHFKRFKENHKEGNALYWNDRDDLMSFLKEVRDNLREIRKHALKAKAIEVNRQLQSDYVPFQDDEGGRIKDLLTTILVEGSKALGAVEEGLNDPTKNTAAGNSIQTEKAGAFLKASSLNISPLEIPTQSLGARYSQFSEAKKSA